MGGVSALGQGDPSPLQLKCSITQNVQSPGQLQTPFFIMIFFSLSLLIKSLKFYLHLTMDKNHLKHLISMLQETHRSQESLQGGTVRKGRGWGGRDTGRETEREWTVPLRRNLQRSLSCPGRSCKRSRVLLPSPASLPFLVSSGWQPGSLPVCKPVCVCVCVCVCARTCVERDRQIETERVGETE